MTREELMERMVIARRRIEDIRQNLGKWYESMTRTHGVNNVCVELIAPEIYLAENLVAAIDNVNALEQAAAEELICDCVCFLRIEEHFLYLLKEEIFNAYKLAMEKGHRDKVPRINNPETARVFRDEMLSVLRREKSDREANQVAKEFLRQLQGERRIRNLELASYVDGLVATPYIVCDDRTLMKKLRAEK